MLTDAKTEELSLESTAAFYLEDFKYTEKELDLGKTSAYFLKDLKPHTQQKKSTEQAFLDYLKSSGALKDMMTGALKFGYACVKNGIGYESAKTALHQTLDNAIEEKLENYTK